MTFEEKLIARNSSDAWGTSHDYTAAISHGNTTMRIGTAIFILKRQ
ncbi:MAG: hypothetical protein K5928_00095 [Prevotella sp.]|nr:hypothetical protein [Prevotella sp.]